MIDRRFYPKIRQIRVRELAKVCNMQVIGDLDFDVSSVAPLTTAKNTELSFFGNKKYLEQLKKTSAGAVIVTEDNIPDLPKGVLALVTKNVMVAYGHALEILYPDEGHLHHISGNAKIYESAKIGKDCYICDNVYIGEDAEIGDDVIIGHNCVIGKGCKIGSGSRIRSNVTISHSILGENVIVNSGARIGESGFGIIPDGERMVFVKQLGRVLIGDYVRIGANTTIDRGSVEDTIIGDNTIIDNLVQIGHNVHIGKNSIIVAQVGIAGSSKIGNGVVLAGQVGVSGHVSIGDGVVVAAKSGIASNIEEKQIVGGIPAVDINIWKRQSILLKMMVMSRKKGGNTSEKKSERLSFMAWFRRFFGR